MKQVDKNHYHFENYTSFNRWTSYWHQLREAMALNPKSVLVIGPGDGVIVDYLKNQGITVKTIDIADDLKPDYLGSVEDIDKIVDESFDLIICSQVLEHLPYEKFAPTISKIKSKTKFLILSLPYANINLIEFFIRLPKKIEFYFNLVLPKFYKKWKFDGEHYWEIAISGFPKSKIRNELAKNFRVKKEFHVKFFKYHYFFVCESR